jgi:protein-L-isoaspartate(D-aspartate) O-methyltransferase
LKIKKRDNQLKVRFLCLVLLIWGCSPVVPTENKNFTQLREKMVREQIVARGLSHQSVVEAMKKVPRHRFVPQEYRVWAYEDRPLPIGYQQTISQPYIVGLMTSLLNLGGDEKVLEIGTGSGYQAAILAELAREVYSIEILSELAKQAKSTLNGLGYTNIHVRCGDGFFGWPKHAPFDAIIVTCAPQKIPLALIEQLKNGGRLVIPVGTDWQELKLVIKQKGEVIVQDIIPVRFVPMIKDQELGYERP